MQIETITTDHYAIPLPVPLSDSMHGEMTEFALVTVRIRDSDGVEGVGYTYTVGNVGGDAVRSLITRDLAPLVQGQDPRCVEEIWHRMWWGVHFIGRGGIAAFAMSAIDIALWDLNAKRQNEPLWRHLGGYDPKVRAYAGGIDLQFTTEALLEQTRGFLEHGFRAIKMKVGRERLSEDVARIAQMRELLGADTPLMVDANMRWSVSEAIRAARAFAPYDLYWLEEPIIPDDIEGHAEVARRGGVPIATGENLHSSYEFSHVMRHGQISFPEPDVATLGGVTPWLKVAHMAESLNLPVTTHGVHDLQVHLLAAIPNASYLEAHGFGLDRYIEHPLVLEDGFAIAPNRPGHGVVLDFAALEQHRDNG